MDLKLWSTCSTTVCKVVPIKPKWIWNCLVYLLLLHGLKVPIKPKWIWNSSSIFAYREFNKFPSNRSGFETNYRLLEARAKSTFPSNRSGFETNFISPFLQRFSYVPIKPKWIWNIPMGIRLGNDKQFPSNRSGFETCDVALVRDWERLGVGPQRLGVGPR